MKKVKLLVIILLILAAAGSLSACSDTGEKLPTLEGLLESDRKEVNLAGTWSGTILIERVLEEIPDKVKSDNPEECEGIDIAAALKTLKGKNLGLKMVVAEKKDPQEPWRAVITTTNPEGKTGDPVSVILNYDSPDVYFETEKEGAKARFDGKLKRGQIAGPWNVTWNDEEYGVIELMGGTWQVTQQN
ncbi:MAG: hypothetical protein HPY50_10885 [Firmicutes bacterium]|nr:hypothetical protein [Bacillota bacterium]